MMIFQRYSHKAARSYQFFLKLMYKVIEEEKMTLSKRAVFSAVLATGMVLAASADNAVLEADFSAAKTPVSKDLFGIFYEDINYAADGGLYGELVQNRSFEFQVSGGRATEKWTDKLNVNGTKSKSRLRTTKESPLNANN